MRLRVLVLLSSLCSCGQHAAPAPVLEPVSPPTSFARHAPAHTRLLLGADMAIDARLLGPYLPECDFEHVRIDRLELAFAEPAELRIDLKGKLPLASIDCLLEGLARHEALGTWKLQARPLPNGVRIGTAGAIADGPGGSARLTQRFEELAAQSRQVLVADVAPGGGLFEARSLEPRGAEAQIGLTTAAGAAAAARWVTAAVAASPDATLRKLSARASGATLQLRSPTADQRLALLLKQELFEVFRTSSESMQPTLLPGDNVIVLKPAHDRAPERGDLVAFASPRDESQVFIKRVIGVAGDHIELDRYRIRLNGVALDTALDAPSPEAGEVAGPEAERWRETLGQHSYLTLRDAAASAGEPLDVTVEPDSVFVLGDNRDNSFDSRHFGSVPRRLLRGRAVFVWLSLATSGPRWNRSGVELE